MNKIIKSSLWVSLLLAAANAVAGSAAPAQVSKTGEASDSGAAGSSSGVAWPSPRFEAGTGAAANCITDKLTGLMWPKNGIIGFSDGSNFDTAVATPGLDNTDPTKNKIKWVNSSSTAVIFTAIANLNTETLCGYSDWRLPNKVELKSLVNYGAANTANWLMYGTGDANNPVCDGACFSNVRANSYWSSTTYAPNANTNNSVWVVDMSLGYVYFAGKTNATSYVWPVRGGQ